MKPILFNTEMVRAIQNGTKTATRRVVKPQPTERPALKMCQDDVWRLKWWNVNEFHSIKVPICIGDILYVRETWGLYHQEPGFYAYKADKHEGTEFDGFKWRPSIHMPRAAARIFLRVKDVKIQRVQDITEEEARKEGVKKMYPYADPTTGETVYAYSEDGTYIAGFMCVWNDCYAKPRPVKVKGVIDRYESYPWENVQETRTYSGKPWYVIGNPWVRVIEFERCEKPEGDRHGDLPPM